MANINEIQEQIQEDIGEDVYDCDEIIETKPTPIELQQYFDTLNLEELYDELPLKNLYIDFEHFKKQIEEEPGTSLLEKFCKLTIKKCRDRIKYISDKKLSLELCEADTNEIDEILKIENEALQYFEFLFVKEPL